jgi:hypothetical protein
MAGHGIVLTAAYVCSCEMLCEMFTIAGRHHEKMKDRFRKTGLCLHLYMLIIDVAKVCSGYRLSSIRPFLDFAEFKAQHCALDAFESIVIADFIMVIPNRGGVVLQGIDVLDIVGILGYDGSSLAICAEILARIEAKASHFR